jgi:hypothetical protein
LWYKDFMKKRIKKLTSSIITQIAYKKNGELKLIKVHTITIGKSKIIISGGKANSKKKLLEVCLKFFKELHPSSITLHLSRCSLSDTVHKV